LHQDDHRDEASLSDSDGPHTPLDGDSDNDFPEHSDSESQSTSETDDDHEYVNTEEDSPDGKDPRTKVLSVLELEDLFVTAAPNLSSEGESVFHSV